MLADVLPDHAGHFIPVEFGYRIGYADFAHCSTFLRAKALGFGVARIGNFFNFWRVWGVNIHPNPNALIAIEQLDRPAGGLRS